VKCSDKILFVSGSNISFGHLLGNVLGVNEHTDTGTCSYMQVVLHGLATVERNLALLLLLLLLTAIELSLGGSSPYTSTDKT
jgi:hypothetical protein